MTESLREKIVRDLRGKLRAFYTHYPYGLNSEKMNYCPEWQNATEGWHIITRIAGSLNDNYQTLYALEKELEIEGIKKE